MLLMGKSLVKKNLELYNPVFDSIEHKKIPEMYIRSGTFWNFSFARKYSNFSFIDNFDDISYFRFLHKLIIGSKSKCFMQIIC